MKKALRASCLRIAFAVAAIAVSQPSMAGRYSTNLYSDISRDDLNPLLNSVVTDKFTDTFPEGKFEIVIISSSGLLSNGNGTFVAIAGVAEIGHPTKSFVPGDRQVVTGRLVKPSAATLKSYELDAIVTAVKDLMAKCERSPTCDVLR